MRSNPAVSSPATSSQSTKDKNKITQDRKNVNSISTVAELVDALGPGAERLHRPGEPTPEPLARLYLFLLAERERVHNEVAQLQLIQEHFTNTMQHIQLAVRQTKQTGSLLNTAKEKIDAALLENIEEVKNLIWANDRRRHKASSTPSTPASLPPPRLSQANATPLGRRTIQTATRTGYRAFTGEDLERRKGAECYTCGGTGHWAVDHWTYKCRLCGKHGPGHTSGGAWCPEYYKSGTQEFPIDLDGYYDDYLGEDAEHNLAT